MMVLLCILGPARFPLVPHICGVGGVYNFVKHSMIPGDELIPNSPANTVSARGKLYALQDNWLKTNHLLGVTFPGSYAIEIRWEGWEEIFPDSARRYIVALSWKTETFYPPIFPLTILIDSAIQVISRILVHQSLVDTK